MLRIIGGGTEVAFNGFNYNANETTHTFSDEALSEPRSSRLIVVGIVSYSAANTIDAVSVAGASASLVVAAGTPNPAVELWSVAVPTGEAGMLWLQRRAIHLLELGFGLFTRGAQRKPIRTK